MPSFRSFCAASSFAAGLLSALLVVPAPLRAEQAEDYAEVWDFLAPILHARNPEADLAQARQTIAIAEGTWFPLQALSGDLPVLPAEHLLAKACNFIVMKFAPVDQYSLEARMPYRGGELVTRYSFAGKGIFYASTPLSGIFARMFGDKDISELKPETLMLAMQLKSRNGPVTILLPKPDLMVLIPQGEGAEIWGRCPPEAAKPAGN